MSQMRSFRRILAGLALALAPVTHALADSFEVLLSVVFFENELAYKDTETFICRNISLTADGDYCHASFQIIDPSLCKVEIVRDIRATWGEGKKRDFILAKEIFTLGNLDLERTRQEFVPEQKAARMRFEGIAEVYRHEGHNYSFDLDDDGKFANCRVDGASAPIAEEECVARGTQAQTASNKMALLYAEHNFAKGIEALRVLQGSYCPRIKIRS